MRSRRANVASGLLLLGLIVCGLGAYVAHAFDAQAEDRRMLIRSGQHDVVTIVEIEARTHNGSASSAIGVTTQGRRVEVTWDDPVPVTKGMRVAVTYKSATPRSAVPADEVTQRALASLEHEANIGKGLETAGAALLLGAAFALYRMRASLRRPRSWPTA